MSSHANQLLVTLLLLTRHSLAREPAFDRPHIGALQFDRGTNLGKDATSVSVKFALYPVYTTHVTPLRLPSPLPVLPLVVVRAETEAEILADKVAAFAGRRYVKGRDVFDIWWLRQRGIEVDQDMVRRKLEDYGVQPERSRDNLTRLRPDRVRQELERFLPLRYRTQVLRPDVLSVMVEEVRAWLEQVLR